MSRSICMGATFLLFALILTGCASEEDRLVKEQVATIDNLAACYGKVVDKPSYDATLPEIGTHKKRLSEIDKQLSKLTPERREAALKKHDTELKEAQDRFKAARVKAAETAWGVKPSK